MRALCLILASVASVAVHAAPTQYAVPKNRPYDVSHYRIELRLREGGAFENKALVTLKAKRPISQVELDAYGLEVKGVTQDGQKVEFVRKDDPNTRTGLLTLKKAVAPGKEVTFQIDYAGTASKTPDYGFWAVPPDEPGGLPSYFTMFEPEAAQQFFPCNDDPSDKATTELFAIVDGRYQVVSNGRLEKDEAFTADAQNLRRVHWVQDKPHSPYLVHVAIGAFDTVKLTGDTPAAIHVAKGKGGMTFVAADATPTLLKFEAAFLGTPYPWAKFDQVGVPHFLWGGMENTSIVAQRENLIAADHKNDLLNRPRTVQLVAHEMAHQWFGNLVTLKWWNDTWLNEGFATYLEQKATTAYYENDLAKVERADDLLQKYFRQETGPKAHPLVLKGLPSIADGFDATSYEKGAAVLQMLESFVGGEAEFKKALKDYLAKYAYGSATSEEFFASIAKSTKKDLKAFQASWLLKKGYPVLSPSYSFSGNTVSVTITQKPAHPDEKGAFVFKLPIVFHRESTPSFHEERVVLVDKPSVTFKFELPAAPQWVNWNKGLDALAKVEVSAVGEQEWVFAARADPDPIWRMQAQLALLGELVNPDAKELVKPTDAALGAVLEALAKDPSPYVRQAVLERLGDSALPKLPSELGPVVLAQAKRPTDLPEDAIGLVSVRAAALALLGKIDDPAGKSYLHAEILKKELDINFVGAFATGVARIGDSQALAALRAAIRNQRGRGYPYFRDAAAALGTCETGEAIPLIKELLQESPGDNDVLRSIWSKTEGNDRLKATPELAGFVKELVVDSPTYSEELKARVLSMLDHVKTPEAKATLVAVAEKAPTIRLQENAKQVLDKNFPAPVIRSRGAVETLGAPRLRSG